MSQKVPNDSEAFSCKDAFVVLFSWNAEDTYPWMRYHAVNYLAPRAALAVSIAALASHAAWAILSDCGVNFQRAGAPVVLISALCYALIEWREPKVGLLSGGRLQRLKLFNPLFILPVLAAVGTLVWGYGDLLPLFRSDGCNG